LTALVIAKPLFCIGIKNKAWQESHVAQATNTLISMALSGKEAV
jgi:hypothetical protein